MGEYAKIVVVVLGTLLLAGCNINVNKDKTPAKSQLPEGILNITSDGAMAESRKGYYLSWFATYFSEKEVIFWDDFCEKVSCQHTDAVFCEKNFLRPFSVWENRIYYAGQPWSIDYYEDGRGESHHVGDISEVVKYHGKDTEGGYRIHDQGGVRYISYGKSMREKNARIWSVPLTLSEPAKIIYEAEPGVALTVEYFYCAKQGYIGLFIGHKNGDQEQNGYYLYHKEDNSLQQISTETTAKGVWFGEKELYFFLDMDGFYKQVYGTGEIKELADFNDYQVVDVVYDGELVVLTCAEYLSDKIILIFCDMNGNKLAEYPCEVALRYLGTTKDVLFFGRVEYEQYEQFPRIPEEYSIWYMKRDELEEGQTNLYETFRLERDILPLSTKSPHIWVRTGFPFWQEWFLQSTSPYDRRKAPLLYD